MITSPATQGSKAHYNLLPTDFRWSTLCRISLVSTNITMGWRFIIFKKERDKKKTKRHPIESIQVAYTPQQNREALDNSWLTHWPTQNRNPNDAQHAISPKTFKSIAVNTQNQWSINRLSLTSLWLSPKKCIKNSNNDQENGISSPPAKARLATRSWFFIVSINNKRLLSKENPEERRFCCRILTAQCYCCLCHDPIQWPASDTTTRSEWIQLTWL